MFGKSSEKSDKKSTSDKIRKEPSKRILLPSERYPNVYIIEKRVELEILPTCPCCSKEMKDSGLIEDSENLTVIPRRFYVVQQKRVKYRCSDCQERLMRNPVIGRKTWYGTHSKRGAETNAVLFSIVESCKINKVNPRDYFRDIVHAIRGHWEIENKLHWSLDVILREDECRSRAGNSAENFSLLRQFALNLVNQKKQRLALKENKRRPGGAKSFY